MFFSFNVDPYGIWGSHGKLYEYPVFNVWGIGLRASRQRDGQETGRSHEAGFM